MRPKLLKRITIRMPMELYADTVHDAEDRDCSLNEVIVNAIENELSRKGTYRLDYYDQLRPLIVQSKGRHCQTFPMIV